MDNNWISVKDRLLDKKWFDYLVATRVCDRTTGVNIAWLNNEGQWSSNDEWICDGREVVTHWMPLPDLPNEEQCLCFHIEYGQPVCWGTKEKDACSCEGYKNKCNLAR